MSKPTPTQVSEHNGAETEVIANDTAMPIGISKSQGPIPPQPLKVLIVGAGIGGLTSALALRRQGHHVEVFEASGFSSEAGAAINICPNATNVLLKLGVDVRQYGAVQLESMRFITIKGDVFDDLDMLARASKWKSEWLLTHRAHLHQQLRDVAIAPHGPGEPVKLHLRKPAEKIDADAAVVTFEDGSTAQGDVVIGADGVHSASRATIAPSIQAHGTKHSAFRFLVTRRAAESDFRTAHLFSRMGCLDVWYGETCRVISYPCADNELLNFVAVHPASLTEATGDYNTSATKDQLLEIFKDFAPALLAIFEKADPTTLKLYPLFDMDTLPTYAKDRFALVGDAAHPFLPHLAQGGAQAIEDGVSLGVMLGAGTSLEDVPLRLQLYNQARYKRTKLLQSYTRIVGDDSLKDGDEGVKKLSVYEYQDYAFDHDEFEASNNVLRRCSAHWTESSSPKAK